MYRLHVQSTIRVDTAIRCIHLLEVAYLLLVLLEVPLSLGLGLVEAVQGHLKVVYVLLQFLLHSQRLHLVPRL